MSLHLRCSSLPLIAKCPQAAAAPAIEVGRQDDAARLGSAVHEALAKHIAYLPFELGDIAGRYDVEFEELAKLFRSALAAWKRVEQFFPAPRLVEYELSHRDEFTGIELTGHIDVIAQDETQIRILDHKTGWMDHDARDQLKGYAWLALQKNLHIHDVYAATLRAREQTIEGFRWSRDDLNAWWAKTSVRSQSILYHPMPSTCQHCRRNLECDAFHASVAGAVNMVKSSIGKNLTPLVMVEVVKEARALSKLFDQVCDWVHAQVQAEGGRVHGIDEDLVSTNQEMRQIVFASGEGILRDLLGERFAEACSVSKTKAEQIIGDAAPRGAKGKRIQEALEMLENAGALNRKTIHKLELKRAAGKKELQLEGVIS